MTPYYADDWLTIYSGDCRAVLAELPADSVDCVVTSPPYWGLRDYGTATWVGGDEGCDHIERMARGDAGRVSTDDRGPGINPTPVSTPIQHREKCPRCGATRVDSQLGLERTPEEYVANMVAVFAEVRRVLKPSGTCWLNLGDSYIAQPGSGQARGESTFSPKTGTYEASDVGRGGKAWRGLPGKNLVGIPWRVAFALQADGWYLRSDIIWAKPNPMPESVTDRPTKAHEYLFLLAKGQWKSRVVELSDRHGKRRHLGNDFGPDGAYSWAGELSVRLATAILDCPEFKDQLSLSALDPKVGEQGAEGSDSDAIGGLPVEHRAAVWASRLLGADCTPEQFFSELHGLGIALSNRHNLRIGGSPTEVPLPPGVYAYGQTAIAIEHPGEVRQFDFLHNQIIQSAPSTCSYYFDADAVREPHIEKHLGRYGYDFWPEGTKEASGGGRPDGASNTGGSKQPNPAGRNIRSVWTIATRPYPGAHFAVFPPELPERCIKAGSPEGGVVLDPFGGSGTTGMVAQRLSRRAILIDLNPDYLKQQLARNAQTPLGLDVA